MGPTFGEFDHVLVFVFEGEGVFFEDSLFRGHCSVLSSPGELVVVVVVIRYQ